MPYKNKADDIAKVQRYIDRNKRIIKETKEKSGCCICGETDYVVLDLHHVDPSTKFRPGYKHKKEGIQALRTASAERVIAEIQKCVVICGNCHRKYHAGRFDIPDGVESPKIPDISEF